MLCVTMTLVMIVLNKIGYKLLVGVFLLYVVAYVVYLFGVINVTSHASGIYVLIFTAPCMLMDALTLWLAPKLSRINPAHASALSISSFMLTVMLTITVVLARSVLSSTHLFLAMLVFCVLYLLFSTPIWLYFLKSRKTTEEHHV